MDMGKENVEQYKKMGITNPNTLADMAFTFYSQMGWFQIVQMEWNEADKTKTITLEHTVESESMGSSGKTVCYCTAGLLAGIVEGAFGIKVRGREIRCRSRGDTHGMFAIKNREGET
jgi:predicted hydrocarbon binding protein